ncbi:hypothetical protein DPMN_081381 [Dreissena polymorpha]|uniref:Uncharacterized protein n=1 Tax=Dreissena polymorpha TaxID=45954 RepID=A0A9D3Y692_DREPO|nr:hypothetical protein DPMN_081381 [Dreissena polymorpha]
MLGKKIKPSHAMNVKDGSICRVRLVSVSDRIEKMMKGNVVVTWKCCECSRLVEVPPEVPAIVDFPIDVTPEVPEIVEIAMDVIFN